MIDKNKVKDFYMKKVIVIGAGILGATTAYKLAKSGLEVTIIDRNEPGQATKTAAGIICPWLSQRRNKAWYHLAKGGARIYPDLITELEHDGELDTGYRKVGAISIHSDHEKLLAMEQRAIKRREDAPEIGDISLLNEQQSKELFPLLADGYQSVFVSGAARVDGCQLRTALLRGAKKFGAVLLDENAHLLTDGSTVIGVKTAKQQMEADLVIATNGAWMNELFKPLHISFKGTFQKGQLLHLSVANNASKQWPLVMPPTDQSIVPFDSHVVIGATHENTDVFDNRVTAGGIYDILKKALPYAPELTKYTVKEMKVGFRPFTPGFLPVIGKISGLDGLLVANGLGASGLTTGPYLGIELAKLALNEKLTISLDDYDVHHAIEFT